MNFGKFIPFFDKLDVGNYAFGRKNEKISSKFPRLNRKAFPLEGKGDRTGVPRSEQSRALGGRDGGG